MGKKCQSGAFGNLQFILTSTNGQVHGQPKVQLEIQIYRVLLCWCPESHVFRCMTVRYSKIQDDRDSGTIRNVTTHHSQEVIWEVLIMYAMVCV